MLIITWMTTIFYFSNQPSDVSGKTSGDLAKKILQTTGALENSSEEEQENLIYNFDGTLRKIAHYTIYTVGGILILLFFNTYDNISTKKKVLFSQTFGTLYATSDEIHQIFIEGRACMWQDVALDSIGIATGIAIFILIIKLFIKIKA